MRDRESESLRIAFLPDTNNEVAGVAGVSRRFETFAEKRRLPLLVVHAGPRNKTVTASSVTRIQLPRGPIIFALDRMHQYGLAFLRRDPEVAPVVQDFDCCDNWGFPVALQQRFRWTTELIQPKLQLETTMTIFWGLNGNRTSANSPHS